MEPIQNDYSTDFPGNTDTKAGQFIPTLNTVMAVLKLISSNLGVSIILIPHAVSLCGLWLGISLTIIFCLISFYTSNLMVVTSQRLDPLDRQGIKTYGGLCRQAVGNKFYLAVCLMVFMMSFFTACAYSIIIRTNIKSVYQSMHETNSYDKWAFIGVYLFCVITLCFFRKVEWIGISSATSFLVTLVISLIFIFNVSYYSNRMQEMDKRYAHKVSKLLFKEKAYWICFHFMKNLKLQKNSAFSDLEGCKVTNPGALIAHLKPTLCEDIIMDTKAMKAFMPKAEFDKNCPKTPAVPQNWDYVINKTYALYLYNQYSLEEDVITRKTNTGVWDVFSSLGLYASGFMVHRHTLMVYGSLELKTQFKVIAVHIYSFAIMVSICLATAVAGWSYLGVQMGDCLFDNMQRRYLIEGTGADAVVNTARILIIVFILIDFPNQNNYCRSNLFVLTYAIHKKFVDKIKYDPRYPPDYIFFIVSALLLTLYLIVGLYVHNFILVFKLTGAFLAVPLTYNIPVICFLNYGNGINENFRFLVRRTQAVFTIITHFVVPMIVFFIGLVLIFSALSYTVKVPII